MKKIKLLSIITILFGFVFILSSCNNQNNNSNNNQTEYYSLYVSDEKNELDLDKIEINTISEAYFYELTSYNKDDYEGWYYDSNYTQKVTFPITLSNVKVSLYGKLKTNVTHKLTLNIYSDTTTNVVLNPDETNALTYEEIKSLLNSDALSYDGYKFGGWFKDEALTEEATDPINFNADLTLYAKWNKYYKLNLHLKNEDDTVLTYEMAKGSQVSLNDVLDFIKLSDLDYEYNPVSIYSDEACQSIIGFPFTPRKNLEGYVTWTPKIYKAVYIDANADNVNDGILKIELNTNLTKDKFDSVIKNTPTKAGYTFGGWYSDSSYINELSFPLLVTDATYICAKWNKTEEETAFNYGYYNGNDDFSNYDVVTVNNATELLNAISNAKASYTNTVTDILEHNFVVRDNVRNNESNWNNAITKGLYLKNSDGTFTKIPADAAWDKNDPVYKNSMTYYEDSPYSKALYTQELSNDATVHVIKINKNIDLGWNVIGSSNQALTFTQNFTSDVGPSYTSSTMYKTYGMTQVIISNANNLLIYSDNGSKIIHGGFKLNSCNNVVIKNLWFDELWQWEDTNNTSIGKVGDYDAYGWAYFKVGYCSNVMFLNCTFGKSYDGQIDVSNQTWNSIGTVENAPYQGVNPGVHISHCNFTAGTDDKNGYIYKMMEEIEDSYTKGETNYLYYKALRDAGCTFEEILYGIAIPQKKAFLCGDTVKDDCDYNDRINVSIGECYFKGIEDRIPKVRNGNAYIFNTIIDNSNYMSYKLILKNKNANAIVQKVNNSWKCGLVSQCMLGSHGASIMAENCIFKGIDSLVKNNDAGSAGFIIKNCSYQQNATTEVITDFSNFKGENDISVSNFKWKTTDGLAPFKINPIDLDKLENIKTGVIIN